MHTFAGPVQSGKHAHIHRDIHCRSNKTIFTGVGVDSGYGNLIDHLEGI